MTADATPTGPDRGGHRCDACARYQLRPVADLGDVPVRCGTHWPTRAEAAASPVGVISLAACPGCGYARNVAFDPATAADGTTMDTNRHRSAAFQSFSAELVKWLAERHPLRGATVLDIGCGQGGFLRELCQVTGARGIGYDAMYAGMPGKDPSGAEFRRGHAPLDDGTVPFDLVTSRHWLAQLTDPYRFLVRLRELAGGRPVRGYLEVPDAGYDLATAGWEVHYPHVSYFDGYALCELVARAGWRITATGSLFAGMFRFVEIANAAANRSTDPTPDGRTPGRPGPEDRDRHLRSIVEFATRHAAERGYWRETVDRLVREGERPVLWGAGSRGAQFLHLADPRRRLTAVVDVNPRTWGRFLPVTGHEVWPPQALAELGTRVVIITNPSHRAEIGLALRRLGVEAELVVA